MNEKLKHCPFCGGNNVKIVEYRKGYGTVNCNDCLFEFPSEVFMMPLDKAKSKWDTRVVEENLCKIIKAMCNIRDKKIVYRQENNSIEYLNVMDREEKVYAFAKKILRYLQQK